MQAPEPNAEPSAAPGQPVPPWTALVLCGGLGTRLQAVLPELPKALAPVDGEPFVVRLLDQLAAHGCAEVVLCTGHRGDAIARELGPRHDGMALRYSREPAPLGTAGALRLAAAAGGIGRGAVVLNGDSYADVDLAAFVRFAREAPAEPALLTVAVDDAARYGRVEVADGRVVRFVEKDGRAAPGRINAGIYWLPRWLLAALPEGPLSLEREVLPELCGGALRAWVADGAFLDIGVPAALAQAPAFFAAAAARRARPRKGLLVVDRDGTLIEERHYLHDPAGVALLPGVVEGLRRFAAAGYEIAVVTNQSGIGRGYFGAEQAAAVNQEVARQLAAHGIAVRGVFVCPHHPDHGCACRKPEPGLLDQALQQFGYAPQQCLVVGDKACDIELGRRRGARTALVRTGYGLGTERDGHCAPDLVVDDLCELAAKETRR